MLKNEFEISHDDYKKLLDLGQIFLPYNANSKAYINSTNYLDPNEDVRKDSVYKLKLRNGYKVIYFICSIVLGSHPVDSSFPSDNRWYYKITCDELKGEYLSVKSEDLELIKIGKKTIVLKDGLELFTTCAIDTDDVDELKKMLSLLPMMMKALGIGG